MFYDIFSNLCKKKGVTPNKACLEVGISRTSTAKWKAGATPNGATLSKLADYFDVTVGFLLGQEPFEKSPDPSDNVEISMDDFTYALYGETQELTEENKQRLLEMARILKLSQKAQQSEE